MNAGTEAESGVRYTTVAIGLHWLMVVLLMGMVSVGVYMSDLQLSPQKLQLYSWHKWGGVTAFLLVVVRLAWRATHSPPPLPTSMPPLLQRAAHAGHIALYLLMIAIPLSGWLMSSAKGFQTVYFGVLPIPDLLVKNEELGKALKQVHELLNWALILLVLGHVGAAIKHHFIDKDGLLWRMSLRRPRTGEH
ncbi:MAG: cytochrome b [Rhodocyclaceae bacterium]|nr:cytochrome b [Rhodocyclaceae bacterium]